MRKMLEDNLFSGSFACLFTNKNKWGMIKLRMASPQLFSVSYENTDEMRQCDDKSHDEEKS